MTTKSLAIKFAAATAIAASFIPNNSLAFVNVESSYSSGGIETDSKMSVLPEIKDLFGFPISAVHDKIREFCGEPTAYTNTRQKASRVSASTRPSLYTRTVTEEPIEDRDSLTWFVEYSYIPHIDTEVRNDLCPDCSLTATNGARFATLDDYEVDVATKFKSRCKECWGMFMVEPKRFALIKTSFIRTDVTHKTNPERNYSKVGREMSVVKVVEESEFYEGEYVAELARRRAREADRAERIDKRRKAIQRARELAAERERQATPPTPPMPTPTAE